MKRYKKSFVNQILKIKCWLLFLLSPSIVFCQYAFNNGFSIGFQVQTTIGTHINKMGFKLGIAYTYKAVSINSGSDFSFNFRHLGQRKNFVESKNSVGVQFFGGKQNQLREIPIYSASRLSNQQFGIGYNYFWYLNNVKTSQRSGAFSLFVEKTRIYFENDIFAGQGSDRFRTGYVFLQYSHNYKANNLDQIIHFQLGTLLWTGETRGAATQFDSLQLCNYKNLSKKPFGKTSHGIFYLGAAQQLSPLYQLGTKIGLDSEMIRNTFQNKLFHNLKFVPSKKINRTANYPILDKNGLPTFNSKNRKKDRFFLSAGLNQE